MKQTNSLQKSYDPYANGRWYRVFLESDGTKVTITDSDFEDSVISGNSVILTKKPFACNNLYFNPHIVTGGNTTFIPSISYRSGTSENNIAINYGNPSAFDYCEIFVFGEKK